MAHKNALEAVDRTMPDLRRDSRWFGGAMILLTGDFRQTLQDIAKPTAADQISACLKSSLWQHVKKLKLTTNMRVALQNDPTASQFSRQLLAHRNDQILVVSTGLISFDWHLRWQLINRKGNLWKSVGLISNFLVFRLVSYTFLVPVLANRLRCLFMRRKINQKIFCIKTHFTDLGFK